MTSPSSLALCSQPWDKHGQARQQQRDCSRFLWCRMEFGLNPITTFASWFQHNVVLSTTPKSASAKVCTLPDRQLILPCLCSCPNTPSQLTWISGSQSVLFTNMWWMLWLDFHQLIPMPTKALTNRPICPSFLRLWVIELWPASWPRKEIWTNKTHQQKVQRVNHRLFQFLIHCPAQFAGYSHNVWCHLIQASTLQAVNVID